MRSNATATYWCSPLSRARRASLSTSAGQLYDRTQKARRVARSCFLRDLSISNGYRFHCENHSHITRTDLIDVADTSRRRENVHVQSTHAGSLSPRLRGLFCAYHHSLATPAFDSSNVIFERGKKIFRPLCSSISRDGRAQTDRFWCN